MKDTYKIWVKFNKYTGNFEREFMAYMFGYESEYSQGDYLTYVEDFEQNGEELFSLRDKLKFTSQEVDDWTENTCYNIANYPGETSGCCGLFVQFKQIPTKDELKAFVKRAKSFENFVSQNEEFSIYKDIKVEDICVTKEIITVSNVDYDKEL